MSDEGSLIIKREADRFKVLKFLYQQVMAQDDPALIQEIRPEDVAKGVGLDLPYVDKILAYLTRHDLAGRRHSGAFTGITVAGIDCVETALRDPAKRTEFFPPVQFLGIAGGIDVARIIQQGTVGRHQPLFLEDAERDRLTEAIKELRSLALTIVDEPGRRDIEANLATAEAQLTRTAPSTSILKESLQTIWDVAEHHSAATVSSKVLTLLQGLGWM